LTEHEISKKQPLFSFKSIINFLKDPTGELPWEEEESSKDVVHFNSESVSKQIKISYKEKKNDIYLTVLKFFKSFNKLIKKAKVGVLVMFYAPWCGHCKKMKPDYSAAATALKRKGILAAANCELAENSPLRKTFNITGYPTILYFKNGTVEFPYGGEHTEKSIIEWMANPTPPKPKEKEVSWSQEEDMHVTFLADDSFEPFIESHANVLVVFYAPWCGHCKVCLCFDHRNSISIKSYKIFTIYLNPEYEANLQQSSQTAKRGGL
jgi:protein disulfide isomerase family A protein 5